QELAVGGEGDRADLPFVPPQRDPHPARRHVPEPVNGLEVRSLAFSPRHEHLACGVLDPAWEQPLVVWETREGPGVPRPSWIPIYCFGTCGAWSGRGVPSPGCRSCSRRL